MPPKRSTGAKRASNAAREKTTQAGKKAVVARPSSAKEPTAAPLPPPPVAQEEEDLDTMLPPPDSDSEGAEVFDDTAATGGSGPAWVDEDETELRGPRAMNAAAVPDWALTAMRDAKQASGADGADDDEDGIAAGLRTVLSRTEPTLRRALDQRTLSAPKPESTLMNFKGGVKDMVWHPSGEVLVVATSSAVQTIHCSGQFTERLSSHSVQKCVLSSVAMNPTGESVVVLPQRQNVPLSVSLRTGKITQLSFADMRHADPTKMAVKGKRVDEFPLMMKFKPGDVGTQAFAIPIGSRMVLGSQRDACITHKFTLPGEVEDVVYSGDHQVVVAVKNRVLIYDVRHGSAGCVRQFVDEGALKVNRVTYHSGILCTGSTSGTVNAYVGESTTPTRTFMNLSASIDLLDSGNGSVGPSMVMGSSLQGNGFRFVNTSTMTVAAAFPEAGMKHGFVRCVSFNPARSVFSVGETGRIVNYAC